jgi:hypothetical protein
MNIQNFLLYFYNYNGTNYYVVATVSSIDNLVQWLTVSGEIPAASMKLAASFRPFSLALQMDCLF